MSISSRARKALEKSFNRENVLSKIFPHGREAWTDKSGRLHYRALKWKIKRSLK